MFSEKLKTIRKTKGLTQEELAGKLNVVRQTVSKWEKGLSVPDADMLIKIAEIFEISVSELLGANLENDVDKERIAEQLLRINEQLAIKNRRTKLILRVILGVFVGAILINIIMVIIGMTSFNNIVRDESVLVVTESENVISNE